MKWNEKKVEASVKEFMEQYEGMYGVYPLEEEVIDYIRERTAYPVDQKEMILILLLSVKASKALKFMCKAARLRTHCKEVKTLGDFLNTLGVVEIPTPTREELYGWKETWKECIS